MHSLPFLIPISLLSDSTSSVRNCCQNTSFPPTGTAAVELLPSNRSFNLSTSTAQAALWKRLEVSISFFAVRNSVEDVVANSYGGIQVSEISAALLGPQLGFAAHRCSAISNPVTETQICTRDSPARACLIPPGARCSPASSSLSPLPIPASPIRSTERRNSVEQSGCGLACGDECSSGDAFAPL
nr:hypothetical protein Iba_chr03eCG4570 [Ipomoea batatas]